jgi:hypothetical protein
MSLPLLQSNKKRFFVYALAASGAKVTAGAEDDR